MSDDTRRKMQRLFNIAAVMSMIVIMLGLLLVILQMTNAGYSYNNYITPTPFPWYYFEDVPPGYPFES